MNSPVKRRTTQQGMALMIGLIFLLLLLIIGVTAVRLTTQQSRMAANYQFNTITFEGAESALRRVAGELRGEIDPPAGTTENIMIEAVSGGQPERDVTVVSTDTAPGINASAVMTYAGQVPAPGYSTNVMYGSIVAHRFQIEGRSTMDNTNALSVHDQGIQRVGPGS